MDGNIWLLLSVAIVLVLIAVGAVAVYVAKKHKRPPDYYAYFIMGTIWFIAGLVFQQESLIGLTAIGFVFMVVGLLNRDKWKQNRKIYHDLTPEEKKLMMAVTAFLFILLLVGLLALYLVQQEILF